jgi:hypothetical protein
MWVDIISAETTVAILGEPLQANDEDVVLHHANREVA